MIFFRCDGNEYIGLGHVMRCLSIADEFNNRQIECIFINSDSKVSKIINDRGFDNIVLNSNYKNIEKEIVDLISIIRKMKPEYVFVDSYYVTENYLQILKKNTKTVYIDDLISFAYPVDYLVNYNIYANIDDYREIYSKRHLDLPSLMLGISYVPLRKEFNVIEKKQRSSKIKKVFVSTGGGDQYDIVPRLIKDIKNRQLKYEFHFIISGLNNNIKLIQNESRNVTNIILHVNETNICSIMCNCDIAISASGFTLYELLRCKVPTISYISADNQIKAMEEFINRKLVYYAGDIRNSEHPCELLLDSLESVVNNKELISIVISNINNTSIINGCKNIYDYIK